ncbi:putative anti-sigma regulatory factor, serine/threonine protein kinase [Candidatus Moduliflexus flocculans]|uniref:Putative anti-sigma regulatory factor, serine/threonine protein kinase n=1 Tax=Candidatus Moduliflexus flocculans TaxID=1499966 RepID=A0A0S6W637_9BACT|nr:putative anti-sigma regulatory factor, serine/threonine protein kinase [Candidatus Moduliflexus flocculans]
MKNGLSSMMEQSGTFEAILDNLEAIGRFVTRFMREEAKLPDDLVNNFEVSVDEHVANLIEHAFQQQPNHAITIVCRHDEEKAQVSIIDDSAGFDPRGYKIPHVSEKAIYELPPGGFGNYFICTLMDQVEYLHRPGIRNELILTVNKGKERIDAAIKEDASWM